MSPINNSQESRYYESNFDFECISENMHIYLMMVRKDNPEKFERSMRSLFRIRSYIDDEDVCEMDYISPRWRMKYSM